MEYYQDAFGAEIRYRQPISAATAESLGLATDHLDETTLYGEISINGCIIACADAVMGASNASSLVSIMLDFSEDVDAAKAMFDKISSVDDQKVTVPFTSHETGGMFGRVVDKYGVNWVVTANVSSTGQKQE